MILGEEDFDVIKDVVQGNLWAFLQGLRDVIWLSSG